MVLGPVQWFKGGKTNICYNAVDRNIESGNGDKIAMYWEGNEPGQDGKLTYSELLEKVCQVNACSCPKILPKVKLSGKCTSTHVNTCIQRLKEDGQV
jgi:hypothetical protein